MAAIGFDTRKMERGQRIQSRLVQERGHVASNGRRLPPQFRVMEITLGELVSRWRGQHVTLDIDLVGPEAEGAWQTSHYEGILDGPYLDDDDPGAGFVLGTSVISGDIAIGGSYISFEPARPPGSLTTVLGEAYVELVVIDLPLVAQVRMDTALWEARLATGGAARCRLSTTQSA